MGLIGHGYDFNLSPTCLCEQAHLYLYVLLSPDVLDFVPKGTHKPVYVVTLKTSFASHSEALSTCQPLHNGRAKHILRWLGSTYYLYFRTGSRSMAAERSFDSVYALQTPTGQTPSLAIDGVIHHGSARNSGM